MKVVSAKEMLKVEQDAYKNGASDETFMEQAGKGVAEAVQKFIQSKPIAKNILLLCGKGNNAGDAYVAGDYLIKAGYRVAAIQITSISTSSKLCQKNHARFVRSGGIVHEIDEPEVLPFPESGIILDGIFGTGFHGVVQEPFLTVIRLANQSKLPIIAIDIPSGLDGNTGVAQGPVIQATMTVCLGLPKSGFFLHDGWDNIGKLVFVDFGLDQKFIDEADADLFMLTPDVLKPLLPPIKRNRNKYQAGYVVGLSGSLGMPGAAMLSSLATLRSGAGIVRLLHPKGMEQELTASPYEIIKTAYEWTEVEMILDYMNRATATFIGPGIGRTAEMRELLSKIIPHLKKPCVIDADALTILAEEDIVFPERTILTPHMGEMQSLLRSKTLSAEPITFVYLERCLAYAEEHKVTLVLKGGPSFIFHPDEEIMVNITGDPGMATAGSGDVLTGIIAALLAQGLHARHAAALGVYLHGLAGEQAAAQKTPYCMIASDIIDNLPFAFLNC